MGNKKGRSKNKIKGKDFCKWHQSFRHFIVNCLHFRNIIQDNIDKGLLQFIDKQDEAIEVDRQPFPEVVEVAITTTNLASLKGKKKIETF